MRLKLDENLHPDAAALLKRHGHDALTVYEQGLRGHRDEELARVCQSEARAIVTFDLDFADIRQYPPQDYAGIIVLRLADQSRSSLTRVIRQVIPLLGVEPLVQRLWIVDDHRVRFRSG